MQEVIDSFSMSRTCPELVQYLSSLLPHLVHSYSDSSVLLDFDFVTVNRNCCCVNSELGWVWEKEVLWMHPGLVQCLLEHFPTTWSLQMSKFVEEEAVVLGIKARRKIRPELLLIILELDLLYLHEEGKKGMTLGLAMLYYTMLYWCYIVQFYANFILLYIFVL